MDGEPITRQLAGKARLDGGDVGSRETVMNDRNGRAIVAIGLFAISAALTIGGAVYLWRLELLR
jgi:hypothetical protein